MKNKLVYIILLLASSVVARAQQMGYAQALEMALRNNHDIRISRINSEIAENNNTLGNAGFLPTLDATGEIAISRNNTSQVFLSGETLDREDARNENFGAGLQLSWTIFDGFRMWARANELDAAEKLAHDALRSQIEVTALDIAQAYYSLSLEQQLVSVYQQNLRISNQRFGILENAKNFGSASGLEVDQAQIDVFNDSITLMEQRNRIANLKDDLLFYLNNGEQEISEININEDFEIDRTLQLEELEESLEDLNTDVLIARGEQKINASLIRQARANYYPEVDLFANYNYNFNQNEAGFVQRNLAFGPSYGVRLRFNLFNGFNDSRLVRNQEREYESSSLRVEREKLQALTNLRQAYRNYRYYLQVLDMQEKNVERAQNVVQVGLRQLDLGVISSIDFRSLQVGFLQAENELFNARYNAKLAEIQLRVLSGQFSVNLD